METKLEMINNEVVIRTKKDDKWVTLYKNPKFTLTGHIKKFHYESDELLVDEMTVEQLSVVSEI